MAQIRMGREEDFGATTFFQRSDGFAMGSDRCERTRFAVHNPNGKVFQAADIFRDRALRILTRGTGNHSHSSEAMRECQSPIPDASGTGSETRKVLRIRVDRYPFAQEADQFFRRLVIERPRPIRSLGGKLDEGDLRLRAGKGGRALFAHPLQAQLEAEKAMQGDNERKWLALLIALRQIEPVGDLLP